MAKWALLLKKKKKKVLQKVSSEPSWLSRIHLNNLLCRIAWIWGNGWSINLVWHCALEKHFPLCSLFLYIQWAEKQKTKKVGSCIIKSALVSLEKIWKPWISLVLYEHAISSLSSTEHTTATVFISTGFLQCPHLKTRRIKQGLETNLLSSVNTVMWAYHAPLSSQSSLTSHR